MDGGREEFLHADGGTATMDISRQGQKLLGFDHFNGFFADGGSRLFQMQFFCGGDHENVIFTRFADRNQRFEYVSGVLSERRREIDSGNRARGQITVTVIRNFLLIQDPHDVGFFFFCHRIVLSDEFAELFDAVERGIVGIVEVVCVVDRRTAEIDQIVAFHFEIHVLEADLLTVLMAVIVKVADHAPFAQIVRADKREKISVARISSVVYAGSDRIVFLGDFIVFDHEFGIVARERHTALISEWRFMIFRIDGVNESGLIFAEAHDIDQLSVGIDRERAFDGHGVHRKLCERGIKTVKGARFGEAPVFGNEKIVVFVAGHDHGGVGIHFVCPRAPFQRFVDSAVITDDILGILVNARVALFAVGAAKERDGSGERFASVGRLADQQIAVFRGAGKHIKLTLMNEELSPKAGHELADVMPCLTVVIGTEDQCQILRMISRKKVHRREQEAVGMANERGRTEISAGKCVRLVIGVQIIDDRADRCAATSKTNTALFALGGHIKFVFRLIGKSCDVTFGFLCRCPKDEFAFFALTIVNIVRGFTAGQPLKMDRIRLRYDTANINISDLRQKRTVRTVTPCR